MPAHHERKELPYSQEQLFSLVADVERYPEFLPWCRAARILERGEHYFVAELLIAFKGIRESYSSRVELKRPDAIDVSMVKGPFDYLTNHWRFLPLSQGCAIEFDLDFRFNNRILDGLIGSLFARATEKMVGAFCARAAELYGMPPSTGTVTA